MRTELVHIGFGNVLAINRVVAIVSPNAAPSKRLVQDGKTAGRIIDMTSGRRTKAVLVMDTGHIVLAAIAPDTIARRIGGDRIAALRATGEAGGWTDMDRD
ncbi:MAG: extracellular matrix/biofilm biosynthesis regulator RemA family protein [Dehalococcoidia bacterium]